MGLLDTVHIVMEDYLNDIFENQYNLKIKNINQG